MPPLRSSPRHATSDAVPNVPDTPVEPRSGLTFDDKTRPCGLPADEANGLFQPLNSLSNLALAVSGGADSLALLVLFSEWRQRTGWRGQAEVLTVDHGLRAESAEEVLAVQQHADERGLACSILHWHGPRPLRNIQAAARDARYRLMADRMRRTGAQALLVAHHLGDQAETFLDRLTRGSGISGLSAMAADEPNGPEGLRLIRPFLAIPRERLEATLVERGLHWASDPSNGDAKYKRTRLRRILELLEQEGLSAEKIAATAGRLRSAREAIDAAVEVAFRSGVEEHRAGPLRLSLAAYRDLSQEVRLRLLVRMIARVSGQRVRPRLMKLSALDQGLTDGRTARHTLSGALFETGENWLWCWKEPGRTPPETLAGVCGEGIWDERYRYRARGDVEPGEMPAGLMLGPLCASPLLRGDVDWPEGWPKDAFACSPVFWTTDDHVFRHGSSVDLTGGETGLEAVMDLVRLPFGHKSVSNYVDEGDGEADI